MSNDAPHSAMLMSSCSFEMQQSPWRQTTAFLLLSAPDQKPAR